MTFLKRASSAFWIAESTAAILLAFNRCLEIFSPAFCKRVFAGKLTLLWLTLPTAFAAYYCIWTKPVGFSGIYVSWFFNPHVGYPGGDSTEVRDGMGD